MAIFKKLKKLRQNPYNYFYDSKGRFTRFVGRWFYDFPKNSTLKKNATPGKVLKKNAVSTRNMTASVGASFTLAASPDLNPRWRYYINADTAFAPPRDGQLNVALYPFGVAATDRLRGEFYLRDGCAVRYLPMWDYFGQTEGMDDAEYKMNKLPLNANEVAFGLAAWAKTQRIDLVVLPYDATTLSRLLVIHCRNMGLSTLCHFPGYAPIANLYKADGPYSIPISDFLLTEESSRPLFPFLADLPGFFIPDRAEAWGCPMRCLQKPADADSIRMRLGIPCGVEIHICALPLRDIQFSVPSLNTTLMELLTALLEKMQPTDHLLISCTNIKMGFMPKEFVSKLEKQYRKKLFFYNTTGDLPELIAMSKDVILPRGLLPEALLSRNGIILYDVPSSLPDKVDDLSKNTDESDVEQILDVKTVWLRFSGTADLLARSQQPWLPGFLNNPFENSLRRILDPGSPGLDTVAVPDPIDNTTITHGRQKYLLPLIRSRKRLYGAGRAFDGIAAEMFIQWGAEPGEFKERPETFRNFLQRPTLFLEDGFIRSRGIWTDHNEPTLSVIMDSRGVYYNALVPNLLESILNSEWCPTEEQLIRARRVIDRIVGNKISKYNYAPKLHLDSPKASGKRTLLLIDQKAGDMSIKYGCATDETFTAMLSEALALGEEVELIIKQHPCAITGSASEAHYTAASMGMDAKRPNIHLVAFDVNPYSLLEIVDDVWVVSSGMGFEALMINKPVRCFGVPFYANYGLTQDNIYIGRRTRKRTLEEIFYVTYILLSRYCDPLTARPCEIERLVEYFSEANSG